MLVRRLILRQRHVFAIRRQIDVTARGDLNTTHLTNYEREGSVIEILQFVI